MLRIYLRRRTFQRRRGLRGFLFRESLAHHLATEALREGVTYATVTLGHMGFVPGSRHVVDEAAETPPETLPTCLELIGRPPVLAAYVAAHGEELRGAVVVRIDGVGLSLGTYGGGVA